MHMFRFVHGCLGPGVSCRAVEVDELTWWRQWVRGCTLFIGTLRRTSVLKRKSNGEIQSTFFFVFLYHQLVFLFFLTL